MFRRELSGLEGTGRKEGAEHLGGQQVASGHRMSRRTSGAKRTPEWPGARTLTRRAPSSLDCADRSGEGVVEWAAAYVERCWICRDAAA